MSFGVSGFSPRASFATATAQTLACELAANADFGIAPAIAASPMTWTFGTCFDFEGHRVDRAPAGTVGSAGELGDAAGLLRRNDVWRPRL